MTEIDPLDCFLSVVEELEGKKKKSNIGAFTEVNIFDQEFQVDDEISNKDVTSGVHNGDTDSSDDEGNRNYENRKYNDCGRNIKQLMSFSEPIASSSYPGKANEVNTKSKSWKHKSVDGSKKLNQISSPKTTGQISKHTTIYTDPIFGIRIITPLISSTVLQERMINRQAVPICNIAKYLNTKSTDTDWVIAGVLCNKSPVKTTQKGNQFIIWTLSDLLGDIKTVGMFLFTSAYKEFWKTSTGTVVGILNPSILEKKEGSKDEATLSVDNSQKIMIFGQSNDLGICRSLKRNGEQCTSIVNKSRCEFCIYHVKQEYQKCSRRSELQSSFAGKGLTALRNKVLGKNEVFYAGKSYMAIPAKRNRKLENKDKSRLQGLRGLVTNATSHAAQKNINVRKAATNLDVPRSQRLKDLHTLRKLGINTELLMDGNAKITFSASHSSDITLQEAKATAINAIEKLKAKKVLNGGFPNPKTNGESQNVNTAKKNSDVRHYERSVPKLHDNNGEVDLSLSFKFGSNENISKNKSTSTIGETNKPGTNLQSVDTKKGRKTESNESVACNSLNKKQNSKSNKDVNVLNEKNLSVEENRKIENEKVSNSEGPAIPKNSFFAVTSPELLKTPHCSLSAKPGDIIDLNEPMKSNKRMSKSKLTALKFIEKNGTIKKIDPNSIKSTNKKRSLDLSEDENNCKRQRIQENEYLSDRFKKMMETQSKHMDLLQNRDDEEKEKYFNKLEMKERMEEKMLNTYKIACKAVRCLKCKYTSFSASDKCKEERHPLRVTDAMKRFFKCRNCSNRTVCLEVVPISKCKDCGDNSWERTAMMRESKTLVQHSLSIRGGEQKFSNSVVTDANLNLLVPDL